MEVATFLRAATMEGALTATWTNIPHEVGYYAGSHVAMNRYAKQVAMGLIGGSGDYVFVGPDGGGWIELKSKSGGLADKQKDFRGWCAEKNVRFAVCRSLDDVIETLTEWGMLNG